MFVIKTNLDFLEGQIHLYFEIKYLMMFS